MHFLGSWLFNLSLADRDRCLVNPISTKIVILQELGIRRILKIIPALPAFHPTAILLQPLSGQNWESASSRHFSLSKFWIRQLPNIWLNKSLITTLWSSKTSLVFLYYWKKMQTWVWKIELNFALSNFLVTILSFPLKIHLLAKRRVSNP